MSGEPAHCEPPLAPATSATSTFVIHLQHTTLGVASEHTPDAILLEQSIHRGAAFPHLIRIAAGTYCRYSPVPIAGGAYMNGLALSAKFCIATCTYTIIAHFESGFCVDIPCKLLHPFPFSTLNTQSFPEMNLDEENLLCTHATQVQPSSEEKSEGGASESEGNGSGEDCMSFSSGNEHNGSERARAHEFPLRKSQVPSECTPIAPLGVLNKNNTMLHSRRVG